MTADGEYDYTPAQQADLLSSCPLSCGLCSSTSTNAKGAKKANKFDEQRRKSIDVKRRKGIDEKRRKSVDEKLTRLQMELELKLADSAARAA
jgi:hypothetical protein